MKVSDKNFLRFTIFLYNFFIIVVLLISGISIYNYMVGNAKLGVNSTILLLGIILVMFLNKAVNKLKNDTKD